MQWDAYRGEALKAAQRQQCEDTPFGESVKKVFEGVRGSPPRRRNLKSERTQPPVGSYDPRTLSLRSLGPKDSRASLGGVSASLSLPDVRLVSKSSSPSPSPERSQLWRTHQDSSTRFGRRADSRSRTAGKLHASKAADKVSSMYVMFPSFLLCVVFARWLERMFSCTTHTQGVFFLFFCFFFSPTWRFSPLPLPAPLAQAPSCGPFARLLLSTACLSFSVSCRYLSSIDATVVALAPPAIIDDGLFDELDSTAANSVDELSLGQDSLELYASSRGDSLQHRRTMTPCLPGSGLGGWKRGKSCAARLTFSL